MKNKWVQICGEKKENVKRVVEELKDEDQIALQKFEQESQVDKHDKKTIDLFKKRKLVTIVSQKSYRVTKGANFAAKRVKLETQLTADMLRTGAWKDTKMKKMNLGADG